MGIKSVPESVLRSGFNEVSYKLLHLLNDYSAAEINGIVKSILGILSVFLRTQELAVWNDSTTKQIFSAILNPFCIHSKPKVGHSCQCCVIVLMFFSLRFSGEKQHSKQQPPWLVQILLYKMVQ